MPMTRVTAEAQKQFAVLPTAIQKRVLGVFARLSNWPAVSGAKALTGNLAGNYRIRTGDYRIVFKLNPAGDPVVWKIGNRRDVYLD
jgi:mRNA-degrading endonuclease RelE of RelBE toxin-antitoxin system